MESSICNRAMPFAVKPNTLMPNSNRYSFLVYIWFGTKGSWTWHHGWYQKRSTAKTCQNKWSEQTNAGRYYRVFRSGMCFSRCLKMTEKRNLHYKTRLFCYQNLPPFHFIAINPVKIFNKCSNLTNVGSQDFAEKFDPHWYEISQIVFFTFIMVPRVHLCHSFLWE